MSASLPVSPQEFKEFNKDWFIKIFKQSFLLEFVTKGIQTSSDGTDPTKAKNLTSWHRAMYEALDELHPEGYVHGERYHELERTLLSRIVYSVMRQKNYDPALFFKAYMSDLDAKDIDTINKLYLGDEALMNLSMDMGDVGKIDKIKRDFNSPTDDQDITVDYILQLDSKSFLKASPLQFNSLNAEMQKDVLLAQHIALGKREVVVDEKGRAAEGVAVLDQKRSVPFSAPSLAAPSVFWRKPLSFSAPFSASWREQVPYVAALVAAGVGCRLGRGVHRLYPKCR